VQNENLVAYGKTRALIYFIQKWQEDMPSSTLKFLSEGKEKKAIIFLSDNRSLSEKEPSFRQGLTAENMWFADFIVAEYYLKHGDFLHASEYYQKSLAGLSNLSESHSDDKQLLMPFMKARLHDLSEKNIEKTGERKKIF